VYGNARVADDAWVYGDTQVYGDAQVSDDAQVSGDAQVYGDARVADDGLIFWASKVGTENGTLTVYNGKDDTLLVTRGCFLGSPTEFLEESKRVHDARTHHEYKLLIEVATSRIEAARARLLETEL
jgi:carbonic anhydrase/acetyltransferase-like protein (isoleucine patch superfamily)